MRSSQVVALQLRSHGKAEQPLPEWAQEQDFAATLNRVLPDAIRVLGWTDVPQDFHARWSNIPTTNAVSIAALRRRLGLQYS